jgi:hypothetical protein
MIDILRVALGEDDPAVKWDITDYVVREDDLDYDERHLLSTALSIWDIDRVSEPSLDFSYGCSTRELLISLLFPTTQRIATTDIGKLNENGLKFRKFLGEDRIEKIQRYAAAWMPNIQGVLFS